MDFFDLHCDTAYEMYLKNEVFCENNLAVSAKLGECFENWAQTFAIWIKEDTKQPFLFYKNAMVLMWFYQQLFYFQSNLHFSNTLLDKYQHFL